MRTEATTDANCMMLNDMAGISIFYPEPTYSCRLKKALPAEAADAAPTLSSTRSPFPYELLPDRHLQISTGPLICTHVHDQACLTQL